MDLLGHLGETRNNAQPPNPTRNRGSSGGQTPSLLLAWLCAPPTHREEVVRETRELTDWLRSSRPSTGMHSAAASARDARMRQRSRYRARAGRTDRRVHQVQWVENPF